MFNCFFTTLLNVDNVFVGKLVITISNLKKEKYFFII